MVMVQFSYFPLTPALSLQGRGGEHSLPLEGRAREGGYVGRGQERCETEPRPTGSSLDTSREKMIHLIRFDLFHNINDERRRTDKGRVQ